MGMNSLLTYARQNQQARIDANDRKRADLLRVLDTLASVGNTAIQGVGDYVQRQEQRVYQQGRDTVEDTFRKNAQQLQQEQFTYDKNSRDAAQALDVARFEEAKLTAEDERKLRARGVDVDKAKQAAYGFVYGPGIVADSNAQMSLANPFVGRQGFVDWARTSAGASSLQDSELAGIYDQLAADKAEHDRVAALQNTELAMKRATVMRRGGGGGPAQKQQGDGFPKTLLEMSQQATSRYNAQLTALAAANRVLNSANSGYAIDPISGQQTKFASEEDRQRVISESQAAVQRLQTQLDQTQAELDDLNNASALATQGVSQYTALQIAQQNRQQKKAQEAAFDSQFFDPMTGENLFNFPEQQPQAQPQAQPNNVPRQQTPTTNAPAAPMRSLDTAWMTPPTSFTQGGQNLSQYTQQQGSTFGAEGLPIEGASPIDDLLMQDEQTDQTMRLEQLIEALMSNPAAYGLPSGASVEQALAIIKSTPDFENFVLVGDNPPVVK